MTAPANRATTIAGWFTAVVLCAVTTLVLLIFIDGYALAMHHRLPPNGTFGFRDETTLSCLSAWYAGQKAGFTWFLFAGGPLLVFNIVFCVSAAMKRRSPSEVAAMSMVTLLLVGVVAVIAGIHADSVARAVDTASCSPPPLQQFGPSFNVPHHLGATLAAGSFAFVQILTGVLLIRNWSRAANGKLQRNPYFGIRTPSTMRSEQAWVAGNRAALRLVPLHLLTGVVTVIALLAVAMFTSTIIVVVTGICCLAVFFALIIYTAVFASRFARSADGSLH